MEETTEIKAGLNELVFRIGMADTTRLRKVYRQMCWLLVECHGEERHDCLEAVIGNLCRIRQLRHSGIGAPKSSN